MASDPVMRTAFGGNVDALSQGLDAVPPERTVRVTQAAASLVREAGCDFRRQLCLPGL
jgi:hypothetical protein